MNTTARELIDQECMEQETKHGYDSQHDDNHKLGELALAAICYAIPIGKGELVVKDIDEHSISVVDRYWPWNWEYFKPSEVDEIKNLVKAAALLRKEIERRLRCKNKSEDKYINGKLQIPFEPFGMP